MANYTPYLPENSYTFTAGTGGVIGGTCVTAADGMVALKPAADTAKIVGVAGFDADAGDKVTVFAGGVHKLTAAAAVTAGDYLISDSAGKVKPAGAAGADHAFIALDTGAIGAVVRCQTV